MVDRHRLAYVALGANLGNPRAQLGQAAARIERLGQVLGKSALYRTAPVGGPAGQEPYLNAVLTLLTHGHYDDPRGLLRELLAIEAQLGRLRRERWGPRTIDLDLLDYGGRVLTAAPGAETDAGHDRRLPIPPMHLPALRLPHPAMAERAFVLVPLAELDPDWRHPVSGLTAPELLAHVQALDIERVTGSW